MLKPVITEKNYEKYLERIYFLMNTNLKEDSKEFNELEILSNLVKNYEEIHYPLIKGE